MFNGAINNFPCLAQVLSNLITCCLGSNLSWAWQNSASHSVPARAALQHKYKGWKHRRPRQWQSWRAERRGEMWGGAISLYLFCYLEWLSPEVQSEVQQGRIKKSGDLCARGHRGINFLTKLSPTIKPKSMPKSPKRDLKNNIFTRQHSHALSIIFPQRTGSSNPVMREKLNALGSSSGPCWGGSTYIYSGIFYRITLLLIQTAACSKQLSKTTPVATKHRFTAVFSFRPSCLCSISSHESQLSNIPKASLKIHVCVHA